MPTKAPPNLTLFLDSFEAAPQNVTWRINEDMQISHNPKGSGKVDYEHVLGRVVGEGFAVNGISNNRRLYLEELWTTQRVKRDKELNEGGLFGAFGHEQELDAIALGEGKASHLVTDFWIENGVGFIEMLILDTETGRNLNTYLRAGKKMAVSSRGYGSIRETTNDGISILDPDTFYLKGWDIVTDPGWDGAYPALVESNENATHNTTQKPVEENKTMDEATKQLIAVNEAKAKAEAKVEVMEATNKVTMTLNENEQLKAKLALYEERVGTLDDVKVLNEGLWKWLNVEPFKSYAKQLGLHQEPGLSKALFPKMNPTIEAFESAAKADQAELEAYRALGKVEGLKVIVEQADKYGRTVKLENLQKVCESFKKVAKRLRDNSRAKKINEATDELVKLFPNVKKEHISKFLESMKPAEALATIKMMNEAYKPAAANPATAGSDKPKTEINESTKIDPFKPVPLATITNTQPIKPSEQKDQVKRLNESMLAPLPQK